MATQKKPAVKTTAKAPAPGFIYVVKFLCGKQDKKIEQDCDAAVSTGIYSTEVNIYNFNNVKASLRKRFIPVVVNNQSIAREPEQKGEVFNESMTLEAKHATMDDCCKFSRALHADNRLKIGFLEIVSNRELAVTAVYTVSDLDHRVASIDVEQIQVLKGAV